jgi:FtsZ family protein
VVTKPFAFEGLQRKKKANNGISELGKAVDALIVIPNDRLVAIAGHKLTLRESFAMVDNVCLNAVRGISDLVMVPGLINVDFADVRTIMTGMGRALMGTGRGTGDKRAIDAAQMAINSPLLEDVSINGATGILVNITGGPDLTLAEVNEACSLIQEAADPDANIIFGSVIDSLLSDEVRLTVIATGFQSRAEVHAPAGASASSGHSTRQGRRHQDQMAVPAQPAPHVNTARFPSAALALGELADDGYPQPYPPVTTAVSYPTVSPMPLAASGSIGTAAYPASDWSSADRPIIRPPVGSAMSGSTPPPADRRRTPMMPALAAEELGIEESEFDKPTYLRRSLAAHGEPSGR